MLRHDTFVVEVRMAADEYVDYIMGETNVEAAISSGAASETEARSRCGEFFSPFFARGSRTVGFDSVLALARHGPRGALGP